MAEIRVRTERFDGNCLECGGPADLRPTGATSLISLKSAGGRLGVAGLNLVQCSWEGHTYYLIDRDKEVLDPFAPNAPVTDPE